MKFETVSFLSLLSKIVDNRGKTCPVEDIGFPLIATNCVKNTSLYPTFEKVRYVNDDTYESWFRGHPLPGDLVFVCKGSPGQVCLVPDPVPFCIAQDMVAIRANEDIVYSKYLFALLRSEVVQAKIMNMHVGTLIPHFKKGDFENLYLDIATDRQYQKIVGDFYFKICEKIELNRQINQTLEQMAQAIFQSWFVDFEPVKAKIAAREDWLARQAAQSDAHDDAPQFSSPVCYAHEFADAAAPAPATQADLETFMNRAAMCAISGKTDADLDAMSAADYQRLYHTANLFPDELVESELGEIPRGWEIGTLADLCALNSSNWTTKNLPDQVDYVDLANTKNGEISAVQVCMGDDIPSRARRILNIGDTIVGTVRPGNRSFAFISRAGLTGSTGFAVLTPNRNELREVVCLLATSDSNIERLTHLADGGAYPAVRPDVVVSGDCVIPPASLHDSFHHAVQAIFDWIGKSKAENESLVSVRDTLLPKLLSGELDISALTDLADNAAEPGAAHV